MAPGLRTIQDIVGTVWYSILHTINGNSNAEFPFNASSNPARIFWYQIPLRLGGIMTSIVKLQIVDKDEMALTLSLNLNILIY